MASLVLEELNSLTSFFCKPGEIEFNKSPEEIEAVTTGQIHLGISIKLSIDFRGRETPLDLQISTTFNVLIDNTNDSPSLIDEVPDISLRFTEVSKEDLVNFKSSTVEYARTRLSDGTFSLLEFILWIQNTFQTFLDDKPVCNSSNDVSFKKERRSATLIHLDHIRSPSRYHKFLSNAAKEFSIVIELVREKSMIYLMIYGEDSTLKDFIKHFKTSNVDIDSTGKPCKERMMTLVQTVDAQNTVFQKSGLYIHQFPSISEVRMFIKERNFKL